MRYDNPAHREMMDLEGLKAWLPGRTSGYAALDGGRPRERLLRTRDVMSLPLFPVTTVGSWPRTPELLRAFSLRHRRELGRREFDQVADRGSPRVARARRSRPASTW